MSSEKFDPVKLDTLARSVNITYCVMSINGKPLRYAGLENGKFEILDHTGLVKTYESEKPKLAKEPLQCQIKPLTLGHQIISNQLN